MNLEGKDYFTREEAAHYACVSLSQWKRRAPELGLRPIQWMGKPVFRRVDIQRAIEHEATKQQGTKDIAKMIVERRRARARIKQ